MRCIQTWMDMALLVRPHRGNTAASGESVSALAHKQPHPEPSRLPDIVRHVFQYARRPLLPALTDSFGMDVCLSPKCLF
jgi:hypothetical protein